MFQPIPGLISCGGVTGRWGLLSHVQMQSGLIHIAGRRHHTNEAKESKADSAYLKADKCISMLS